MIGRRTHSLNFTILTAKFTFSSFRLALNTRPKPPLPILVIESKSSKNLKQKYDLVFELFQRNETSGFFYQEEKTVSNVV